MVLKQVRTFTKKREEERAGVTFVMNFFTFLNFRSSVVETPVKLTVDFSPIDFLHRQPPEIGNYKGTVSRD
jgi:hypothetical protein